MSHRNDSRGKHVAPDSGKVIDLQGHQEAEKALDALLSVEPDSDEFARLLVHCLTLGNPLLLAVTRRLDAVHPSRLDALGRVVLAYPRRGESVNALLRAAADSRSTDSRRMGAMLVLEHFLGVTPPRDFLATLREPVGLAVDLLTGALEDSANDPSLLHDYLRVLISQQVELLYAVLEMIIDVGGDQTCDVLRLLALHRDPDLRNSALEALGARGTREAVRALATLVPNLPPESARLAARAVQKSRLSGLDVEAAISQLAPARALLGPIDGNGSRQLWLIAARSPEQRDECAFLGLVVSELAGLFDAVGSSRYPAAAFPPPAEVGTLHAPFLESLKGLSADNLLGEHPGACLEVPFEYGLAVLRRAVQQNWQTNHSLPVEYQLLSGLFWERAGLQVEWLDDLHVADDQVVASIDDGESDLLYNSLFDGWYLESAAVDAVAEEVIALDGGLSAELTDKNWRLLLPAVIRLAHDEFDSEMRVRYATRLRYMSEWLQYAGQEHEAALALSAARTMLDSPPEANLFVLRLVQKGILVALSRLPVEGKWPE